MRILYWTRLDIAVDQVTTAVRSIDGVTLEVCESLDDCLRRLPDADGMILYNAREEDARRLVAGIGEVGHALRWMHFLTAGKEGFDAAGIPEHIVVTGLDGASAPVVAEHALALLLALGRRLPDMLSLARERRWNSGIGAESSSLEGKTMAIVGYGHIGREIARRARGFGLRIVAVARSGRADDLVDEVAPMDKLHAVLQGSDVIMVAIALAPSTRHLLDRAALRACRRGALLVNVSRGAVIDQSALRDALASGQLAGAGLDVTDPEPLPADDPLWACPNVIVSPHIGANGNPQTIRRMVDGVLAHLHRLRAGDDDASAPRAPSSAA